jgi:hypothetical protein
MLRRVTLVITDVSEERSASFIRLTRIGEVEITLACVGVSLPLPFESSKVVEDALL